MGGWIDMDKVYYLMAFLRTKPEYIQVDRSLVLYLDSQLMDMGYTLDMEKTQSMLGTDFWYRRVQ